jgi:hypothetical protein
MYLGHRPASDRYPLDPGMGKGYKQASEMLAQAILLGSRLEVYVNSAGALLHRRRKRTVATKVRHVRPPLAFPLPWQIHHSTTESLGVAGGIQKLYTTHVKFGESESPGRQDPISMPGRARQDTIKYGGASDSRRHRLKFSSPPTHPHAVLSQIVRVLHHASDRHWLGMACGAMPSSKAAADAPKA